MLTVVSVHRYVVAPAEMWGFLAPKVQDKTEFDYNMSGRKVLLPYDGQHGYRV